MYKPLADLKRPREISEVVGQKHILSENSVLRILIDSGQISNMIFYGPSGVGKTTVARIVAKKTNRKFVSLNATTASISDVKKVIEELDTFMAPNGVLLYLDEIQYFNKKQQQSLLEFIENGKIILIASTTENPYFYVYNAILSRSTVYEFKPVEPAEIKIAISKVFETVDIDDECLNIISHSAMGDVRKAINVCENVINLASMRDNKVVLDDVITLTGHSRFRYDKDGDEHYNILSAFQKSIRGSDPDASIHYLARLIKAGDLKSICRRLVIIACEDIGLAYPQAITIVKSCVDSALMVGFPEAKIPLSQAVILLATAPKSDSANVAIGRAMYDLDTTDVGDVPKHLKDAHYPNSAKLGNGSDYKFPHAFAKHYVKQQYLPDGIKDNKYYEFGENKFEFTCKDYWDKIKKEG